MQPSMQLCCDQASCVEAAAWRRWPAPKHAAKCALLLITTVKSKQCQPGRRAGQTSCQLHKQHPTGMAAFLPAAPAPDVLFSASTHLEGGHGRDAAGRRHLLHLIHVHLKGRGCSKRTHENQFEAAPALPSNMAACRSRRCGRVADQELSSGLGTSCSNETSRSHTKTAASVVPAPAVLRLRPQRPNRGPAGEDNSATTKKKNMTKSI